MKFIKKLLIVIVILIVLIVIGRNIIVRHGVPIGGRFAGIRMSLGKVNIGLTNALIGIKDIEVMNPKGFPKGQMVEIKEIYIDPEVASFLKNKIHLVEVRFNLDNLVIIKNEKGEFNFNKLTQAQEKQDGKPEEEELVITSLKQVAGLQIFFARARDQWILPRHMPTEQGGFNRLLRSKKATAPHQSPEIRMLPYIWILLDCISIRYPEVL